MTAYSKSCIACNKPLKGRVDKKFCDDYCRNNYNNRLNSDATPFMRTINNMLRKNRRILEESLNGSDKPVTVHRKALLEKGFRFEYFTHYFINQKGSRYFFCYDYGYLPVEKDNRMLLVVKGKKELVSA